MYVDLITTKSVKWSQKEIFLDQRKYAVPIWIDNNIIENFEHRGNSFLNEAHLVLETALKCHSRVQFYIRSTFTILSIELTIIKQFMNNLWRESFMMMCFSLCFVAYLEPFVYVLNSRQPVRWKIRTDITLASKKKHLFVVVIFYLVSSGLLHHASKQITIVLQYLIIISLIGDSLHHINRNFHWVHKTHDCVNGRIIREQCQVLLDFVLRFLFLYLILDSIIFNHSTCHRQWE